MHPFINNESTKQQKYLLIDLYDTYIYWFLQQVHGTTVVEFIQAHPDCQGENQQIFEQHCDYSSLKKYKREKRAR
jgi:hypothetical protein